jgi:hypothetical protein
LNPASTASITSFMLNKFSRSFLERISSSAILDGV